nr:MAG TPA: Protein of unknown function (DUF551) [Caudoviricetes sp.]
MGRGGRNENRRYFGCAAKEIAVLHEQEKWVPVTERLPEVE